MYFIILIINILIAKKYINNTYFLNIKYSNIEYLIFQINNNIEKTWGIDEIIISNSNLLKYYNNNTIRSYINFDSKKIIVETILEYKYHNILKNIILNIILENKFKFIHRNINNNKVTIYKILDNYGYPIESNIYALKFIDYIFKNNINIRKKNNINIYYITINIYNTNNNYIDYINIINKYSKKYNIDKFLILSIIDIESKFNPYAISKAGAIGLMQIIKKKSGLDVFKSKGINCYPNKKYLFNPENNIDIGVLYLKILKTKYLCNVKNEDSMRYLMIMSYNGGINNVLKIFSSEFNESIKIINNINNPNILYKIILDNHPLKETKDYLIKVDIIYNIYKNKILLNEKL